MLQTHGIGSVSSGTMREEDLIPAFFSELEDLDTKEAEALAKEYEYGENFDFGSEDSGYLLGALFDALNGHAMPFFYFGAHPGDGADYGWWFSDESFEEAARCGEVLKIDAGDEWPEDLQGAEYVAEVTDHGNVTLYTTDHKEMWAIV